MRSSAPVTTNGSSKVHHVAYLLESWEQVLRAADLMSMNEVSIDIGLARHGITRGATIYAFDRSGNRFETFCGGYQTYPDNAPFTWTLDEIGTAIFLPRSQAQRSLPVGGDLMVLPHREQRNMLDANGAFQ